jgi:hypothetical protein
MNANRALWFRRFYFARKTGVDFRRIFAADWEIAMAFW